MSVVGFLGLGTMGAAMATRLVDAGHEVHVWNRSPEPMAALVAAGATAASTPQAALAAGGIAFSMFAHDRALEAVLTDEVLTAASGSAHINMATVSVATARALGERHERAGVAYAAAPVLGRPAVAAAGNLNIVASGSAVALERAAEFFPAISKQVWEIGDDPGQATLVKIGVNYNLIHTIQALAESLNLMEHGGVNPKTFVEILTDAAYTGSAYGGYGPQIATRAYNPPAFSVELGLKDLSLAEAAAADSSAALPTAPVLREMFERALADEELAALDWSAIAEITRRG